MCVCVRVYIVRILFYMRPHRSCRFRLDATMYTVASYYHICVLILPYMCPHTTIYVSLYYYMCPHTTIHVSSYYHICVRILLLSHTCVYIYLKRRCRFKKEDLSERALYSPLGVALHH